MAFVGQVGTVQVAGITLSLTGLKILHSSLSAGTYSVFYDASIGAARGAYQVPTGKTFQLYAVFMDQIDASSTVGGQGGYLLYGDTNPGLNGSVPTNPVGLITGVATTNAADCPFGPQLNGSTLKYIAIGGSAPQNKYIVLGEATANRCTIYGYEV